MAAKKERLRPLPPWIIGTQAEERLAGRLPDNQQNSSMWWAVRQLPHQQRKSVRLGSACHRATLIVL
jgi:hypothetical protein